MALKKIVVAITGASGAIYARVLLQKLEKLKPQIADVGVVMTDNSKQVWEHELGNKEYENFSFKHFSNKDYNAPFASGSAKYEIMMVCPCSMGTLGRIAHGISDSLITRAADVILKERRKLILVTRDTPLSLIHINNMKMITEAGGIICPASPSFYSKPNDFEELSSTVIDRCLELAGLELTTFRWNDER